MLITPDSRTQAEAVLHHNRAVILAALTRLDISAAYVRYSGGGDSGDVTDVEVTPKEALLKAQAEPVTLQHLHTSYREGNYHYDVQDSPVMLDEALRDFTMDWVELHHAGWENNDGASGTLTVDVADNCFELEHESYYTESFRHAYNLDD